MAGIADDMARWRRRDGLSVTAVDDDAFVVDPQSEAVFHLNALGRALWNLLDTPQSTAEMIALLHEAFPDAGAGVEADVRHFVARMAARALIEPAA